MSFTANKNITGEVIPEGFEPYSDHRPGEEISVTIAQASILGRMTPSIIITVFGNKVIVELKRSLFDIFVKVGDIGSKRKKMMDLIKNVFDALDSSHTNSDKYLGFFEPMSDNKFISFFKEFFADEHDFLVLEMVDFERDVTIEKVEKAANILNVPLYETVYMPHITMDKENPVGTKITVPVGYAEYKRTQQTLSKKNGLSTSISKRSAITGQVTGSDKNGRESDLENSMLTAIGANFILQELNGPRADDQIMKTEMLSAINNKGFVNITELTNDPVNKTTLNTADVFLLGMSLKSDLVTNGLMLKKTINEEME